MDGCRSGKVPKDSENSRLGGKSGDDLLRTTYTEVE